MDIEDLAIELTILMAQPMNSGIGIFLPLIMQ